MEFDINNIIIEKLNSKHSAHVEGFSCLKEDDETLNQYKSKKRKKFKKHSENIDVFFKKEALKEQEQSLNTTHLFFLGGKLIGFISLCADSIRLDLNEKEEENLPFVSVPALKIARLAIDKNFQFGGLGKLLIQFSVKKALEVREIIGVRFLTVDCYEHRLSYYKKFGFIQNGIQREGRQPDQPLSLRLNIDTYLENM